MTAPIPNLKPLLPPLALVQAGPQHWVFRHRGKAEALWIALLIGAMAGLYPLLGGEPNGLIWGTAVASAALGAVSVADWMRARDLELDTGTRRYRLNLSHRLTPLRARRAIEGPFEDFSLLAHAPGVEAVAAQYFALLPSGNLRGLRLGGFASRKTSAAFFAACGWPTCALDDFCPSSGCGELDGIERDADIDRPPPGASLRIDRNTAGEYRIRSRSGAGVLTLAPQGIRFQIYLGPRLSLDFRQAWRESEARCTLDLKPSDVADEAIARMRLAPDWREQRDAWWADWCRLLKQPAARAPWWRTLQFLLLEVPRESVKTLSIAYGGSDAFSCFSTHECSEAELRWLAGAINALRARYETHRPQYTASPRRVRWLLPAVRALAVACGLLLVARVVDGIAGNNLEVVLCDSFARSGCRLASPGTRFDSTRWPGLLLPVLYYLAPATLLLMAGGHPQLLKQRRWQLLSLAILGIGIAAFAAIEFFRG